MRTRISSKEIEKDFVNKVTEISGQNLLVCYQCGKCSAGCPSVSEMDLLPNQVIRFAQLGMEEDLLASNAYWVCASCLTCNVRCPKGVNIAEIMEALRQINLRKNVDHLPMANITQETRAHLPTIALVGHLRKHTA